MKLIKPKFWKTKNFFSFVLLPFSFFLELIIFFKKVFTKVQNFNIPIICVGNIYIGGTGKTPTSILIANELYRREKKPAIIKKYYENHYDEHRLIKAKFNNLFLNKKRISAINKAIDLGSDSIILDDGFQDLSIKKDLSILCFNENQLIGNGLIFPSGPLRENISALKHAHIIMIIGQKNLNFEKKILSINSKIEIYYSNYVPRNIDKFRNKKLFAFAGIGNPENFFKLLKQNNLLLEKQVSYPDHYKFKKNELVNIIKEANDRNCEVITTEKDYFRLENYGIKNLNYLTVELQIENKEKLIKKILELYDKKS